MKKLFKTLPLLMVASLSACDIAHQYPIDNLFCFDTVVTVKTTEYNGLMYSVHVQEGTCQRLKEIDAVADAYKKRDVACIYDLNNTNEEIEISEQLYKLLKRALDAQTFAPYYNPFIGSLSNKWKEALSKGEILSESIIQEELNKMKDAELILGWDGENKYTAQRVGEALIDVGAIAKGYALDVCESYLHKHAEPEYEYMIDAGNSSILLGRNKGGSNFKIKIKDLSKPTYLYLKDSFVSTSGTSEQGVKIGDNTYSHIINPNDGSAINNYDAVIVIAPAQGEMNGFKTDALSTSFMLSSIEEIEYFDYGSDCSVIVIKDDNIVYSSESLELYHG